MPVVALPNGTELDFPDGMSEDAMRDAIFKNFPEYAPRAEEPIAPSDPSGAGDGAAIMAAAKPVRTSVLEDAPPDPAAWDREMERQSRRAAPQPANTPPAEPPRRPEQSMRPAPEIKPRGVGGAVADTVLGLGQGAVGLVKGVADNWNAGDNPVSDTLGKSIQGLDYLKSDELRNTLIQRDGVIQQARRNGGELAAARAALNTLFAAPQAAGDVAAQGAGSLLPIVGLSALRPAAMWATNALANAGSAASQTADALRRLPPADWQNDTQYLVLMRDGATHDEAVATLAPIYALPSQGIGFLTGALSGRTGVERALAGRAAGDSLRARVGSAGAELLGEQAETLAPQAAGNLTVGGVDQRTGISDGLGQASVDTLAGAAPGAGLAAALPRGAQQAQQPSAEQMARDRGFLKPADRPVTAPIAAIAPAQTTDEAIVAAARALDEQTTEDTQFQAEQDAAQVRQAMQDEQALEARSDQSAQAVANIGRILEQANVSPPAAVLPTDPGAAGPGPADATPSLDPGLGTDGAGAPAGMVAPGPADTPTGETVSPATPDPLAELREGNAALRAQAIQALQTQQVAAAPAGPVPAPRGDEPVAELPAAGPAPVEAGGVAAPAPGPAQPAPAVALPASMPAETQVSAPPAPPAASARQVAMDAEKARVEAKRAERRAAAQQRADFAAAEKARTAPGNRARARAHDANPFKAFIAKHGISTALANEFAPGRKERQAALVQGYGPVFRKSGLQLDALAELAVQDGYLTTPDVTKLSAMIADALRGKRVIPQYAEGAAETEMEARAALEKEAGEEQNAEVEADTRAEREAIQALAELSDESLQALAEDDVVLTAGNNVSEADFLRALGATEQEIEDATQGQGRKGQDAESRQGAEEAAAPAAPRGAEGRDGQARVDEEGLTAPTRADIEAQQARAETAPARDQREQVRRESEAGAGLFELTQEDGRQDTTGNLFDQPASQLSAAQLLRAAADKMEGRAEKPAEPPVAKEPESTYTAGYETDLFGNPVPQPAGANRPARSAGAAVQRDSQPRPGLRDTQATAGDYYVNTFVGSEVSRKLGAARVRTPAEAAQATAYLYKSAVERFDGLVTDLAGKPLGVVGGFKGATSQTSVYQATVMAEAVRIPGAARIWFSHNHPSGTASLSKADLKLNQSISNVFRGSGIEPMGLLAVAGRRYAYVGPNGGDESSGEIAPPENGVSVPVIEREVSGPSTSTDSIFSPDQAKRMAAAYFKKAGGPGLMLLDSQNNVAGWVPVSGAMKGELRDTGAMNSLYRAISQSNASAVIIVHDGDLQEKGNLPADVTASENIAAALDLIDVRPLDSINVETMRSAAETGQKIAAGPVYSREGQLPAVITPSTVARVQAAITELLGGKQLAGGLGRVVATTAAEIKTKWEPLIGKNVQIGSEGEAGVAQGFYDPRTKTVFLIADNINQGDEGAVLAHELMHKHGQAVLGEAGWNRLHGMIGTWKDAKEGSDERRVYDYAAGKVEAVGQELSTQELFPYAVEGAIKQGIKPSLQAKRGTVANWLESVRQSLKSVWGRITGKPETFKAQDLVDLAFGIAQMEDPENAAAMGNALRDKTGGMRHRDTYDIQTEIRKLKEVYSSLPLNDVAKPALKARLNALREELNDVAASRVRMQKPSDDALTADYASPDEVPADVMRWVQTNSDLLTSDASDAVRWARIADTVDDERFNAGPLSIYRAVADGDDIRPGDWVTTDRKYAEMHLSKYLNGKGEILEQTVNGRDVLISPTGNNEEAIYAPRSLSGPIANEMENPGGEVLRGALADQTDTPAFRKWFGDSKVVDADGKPLVVYHGTTAEMQPSERDGNGLWFTNARSVASIYATERGEFRKTQGEAVAPNVVPAYLSIKNPLIVNANFRTYDNILWEGGGWTTDDLFTEAKKRGHDGLIVRNVDDLEGIVEDRELYDAPDASDVFAVMRPEQIKSATGNRGTFDPANPDIRFSRSNQPPATGDPGASALSNAAKRANSPWRDATGRLQFAPGQWLFDKIDQATSPVLNWKYLQLKAASPELRRMLRDMKLQVEKAQETAAAVAGEAFKLTDAERAMVSDLVEKEVQAGVTPPAHAVQLAAMINEAMGRQTDELIRLGMLTKDAAEKWRGQYLPRYYETKLGKKLQDVWADSIGKMFRQPRAMQGIRGKHLKGRGLYQTIPENQLANYEALGWEVRDTDYQPGLTGDGTVQVWRDFTRQERDKMGEIRDAGFRFVMGYMQTQKDIALGQLYDGLASNTEMSSRTETEKFSAHVPDTKVTGTGAHVYGRLAGRWVSPETMSQLSKGGEEANEALQMYRKAMSYWKQGKTSLNPVAHANNVMSNVTMAHFAGVSYWRPDSYVDAIRDLVKKAPMVKEAKDAGLFLGSMSETELMNTMPEQLRVLAGRQDGAAAKAGKTVWDLMTFWLSTPMGKAYQAEDSFFRYLIYRDSRQRGLEPADAVDYAQKYIFTYDDLPKGARMIRDFGMPFFAYTYKAIPALLHTALTHPDRLAAPAAVLWAVNAAAYALAMDDDDDWLTKLKRYVTDSEFRDKVREAEKLERRYLPEWMKGTTSLGTPKTIRMGMDEVTALPLFMDMSRMMPGGDLFDVNPNAGGIPLPQPITPNHPFFTLSVGLLANKDLFLGKDLTDANDTSAEKAEKRLGWLWRQMSPAIAVNNYHWQRWMNAASQATGGELKYVPDVIGGDSTGVGRDGLPVQPKYAALQTVGIKLRPIDLDVSEQIEANQRRKMIRDIDAEIRGLKRLSGKGAINDAALEKEMEKAQEKKQRLREGLTVDGDEVE